MPLSPAGTLRVAWQDVRAGLGPSRGPGPTLGTHPRDLQSPRKPAPTPGTCTHPGVLHSSQGICIQPRDLCSTSGPAGTCTSAGPLPRQRRRLHRQVWAQERGPGVGLGGDVCWHSPHWFSSEQSLQSQMKLQSFSAALLQLLTTVGLAGRAAPATGETTELNPPRESGHGARGR